MTFHLGDIKNGSSRCDDPYFQLIRSDFDKFVNPLIYTPGDNEWTDCHRVNNGSYNPLERLAFDRKVFFNQPGMTLGQNPIKVNSQAWLGFPENVNLRRQGVDFAVVNVVGSNDDLQPWTGIGNTPPRAGRSSRRSCGWPTRSTWCTRLSPRRGSGTTGLWR